MERKRASQRFDAKLVLAAYRNGFFPMAESRTGPISWFSPDPRAIIPINAFNVPRSFRRVMARADWHCTINSAFDSVIRACAERGEGMETWISDNIIRVYTELHRRGIAHSVETWRGDTLIGGLYGLAIGGAFFGESMFSRESNASKLALVRLAERLRDRGFRLLDSQIINDHVKQFGAVEIPRSKYLEFLSSAIRLPVKFID
ncbi:MAG: leucyl/phenylalanyl-tRNA--protein transferase [Bacteroidota bacterium]